MSKAKTVEQIMAILPQTQCQACDHTGCLPYAKAMTDGQDTIDHCQPGGLPVLEQLGAITQTDTSTMIDAVQRAYKAPSVVHIDPEACIGCTKCIQACPTGAIIGAPKAMHVIIEEACTGCDLCLPVCPVDCMHPVPITTDAPTHHKRFRKIWRQLHERKQERDIKKQQKKDMRHQSLKGDTLDAEAKKAQRMAIIKAAMQREHNRRDTNA